MGHKGLTFLYSDPQRNPSTTRFTTMSGSDSPQVQLMKEWNKAFEKKDLDGIAKSLHKDYRHIPYPRSLGLPE